MRKTKLLYTALISCLFSLNASAVQTVNIDSGLVEASLINNKANVLTFPFIVEDAKIATAIQEDFQIKAKKDSIVIIPTATAPSTIADLIVWSADGYTYLIKLDINGKDQVFNFTSNRVQPQTPETIEFESGKIDEDIKKLLKTAMLDKNIPGYKKTKVKRQFVTPDLLMQKEYIFDGSKYRVEKWFLKNETSNSIKLDEGNIYTKGILAIAFESQTIPANKIGTMFLIIDKASVQNVEAK